MKKSLFQQKKKTPLWDPRKQTKFGGENSLKYTQMMPLVLNRAWWLSTTPALPPIVRTVRCCQLRGMASLGAKWFEGGFTGEEDGVGEQSDSVDWLYYELWTVWLVARVWRSLSGWTGFLPELSNVRCVYFLNTLIFHQPDVAHRQLPCYGLVVIDLPFSSNAEFEVQIFRSPDICHIANQIC